jgi:hypothetical protein
MSDPKTATHYDTLTQATQGLKQRGFTEDFTIDDAEGKLISTNHPGLAFEASQVKVEEFHRFEGESDPNDMTIIYALSSPEGKKGVLIDAFGTYSDPKKDEFIKQLNITQESQTAS